MLKRVLPLVLITALGGGVLVAQDQPFTLHGRVVSVHDGDTITVLDAKQFQHRIRFNGIDAPELGQPFSQRARQHLADLVADQDVTVDWTEMDRYGRILGTVTVGTTNVNLAMLETGFAWYFRRYEEDVPEGLRATYDSAEGRARGAGLGLWQDASPVAPWDYRNPPIETVVAATEGRVIGNMNSGIYHVPGCRDYSRVAEKNRRYFESEAEARDAGFRKAGNC